MKKNPTPSQIALACSALQAFLLFLLILLYLFFYPAKNILLLLLLPIVVFAINYWVVYSAMNNFIYRKIKNIYKTIHNFKRPKSEKTKSYPLNTDILGAVEDQVNSWGAYKEEEIQQLKKMEQFRKEYIGNVSHELKTPIFNVQGYITTLLDGGLYDNEINYHYLKRADVNIERLANIVDELETISTHESGKLELEWSTFDILKLTKETFEMVEMHADAKDITLSIKDGFNKPIFVYADRDKIQHILLNLLTNSIKYGKKNGKTSVGYYHMDENLLIEVSDNGIGINEKHLPRLFERFYRVDKSRSRDAGGTGLGLSIVKHIIEAHRQTINVRSSPNIGSTFGFTLKRVK